MGKGEGQIDNGEEFKANSITMKVELVPVDDLNRNRTYKTLSLTAPPKMSRVFPP